MNSIYRFPQSCPQLLTAVAFIVNFIFIKIKISIILSICQKLENKNMFAFINKTKSNIYYVKQKIKEMVYLRIWFLEVFLLVKTDIKINKTKKVLKVAKEVS